MSKRKYKGFFIRLLSGEYSGYDVYEDLSSIDLPNSWVGWAPTLQASKELIDFVREHPERLKSIPDPFFRVVRQLDGTTADIKEIR